ncbi:MAG: hypothetical protein MI919_36760 [Holophagales bacterium]|nr:hypothetical protein [Holophagales bacterium]
MSETDPHPAGHASAEPSSAADGTGLGVLLLLTSLLLAVILVAAMLHGDAERAPIRPHPEHPSMLQTTGSPGPANVAFGYAAGLSILLLMGLSILLGVRKSGRQGRLGLGMALGTAVLALVFTALVLTYSSSREIAAGEVAFFGGFPVATAWMIYGMWWMPVVMTFALSYVFDRYWLTPVEVEEVRRLAKQDEGEAAGGSS